MNAGFGGAEPKGRDTELESDCVGPFPNTIAKFYKAINVPSEVDKHSDLSVFYGEETETHAALKVGDIQRMVYTDDDVSPFSLSCLERIL